MSVKVTEREIDAMTEIINIGVGHAASSMSDLINMRIDLKVPHVQVINLPRIREHIRGKYHNQVDAVYQDFTGKLCGRAVLAFAEENAVLFARMLAGADSSVDCLDMDMQTILTEVGNIILCSVLGALSNFSDDHLSYTIPQLCHKSIEDQLLERLANEEYHDGHVVLADAEFQVVETTISGAILLVFKVGYLELLLNSLKEKWYPDYDDL